MFWIFVVVAIILFILLGMHGSKKQKEIERDLKLKGYSLESKILTGKYVAGHPDLNDQIPVTIILPKGDKLIIMAETPLEMPVKKAEIGIDSVKNILAEDQSTVEKRVTVGRLLTVGIFAFAWKKKKKNELAFLTIEWNDGRFDHETIFQYEETDAMQKANTARNQLIKQVR